jgi:acylphosphatase
VKTKGAAQRLRRRVIVAGLVQDVWFRASTRKAARRAGVDGWVRNLPDGRVEAVFEGEPEAVETMIGYCSHGPELARVDEVAVTEEPLEGVSDFKVR